MTRVEFDLTTFVVVVGFVPGIYGIVFVPLAVKLIAQGLGIAGYSY